MNDTENNDFTVIITDHEEPCRSGSSVDNPEPSRSTAAAKLIALWNLLFELIVGVPFIFLMSWVGDDFGAGAVVIGGLLFACAHTAASTVSFKRYERKYEVSAPKFVTLNALPLFLIGAVIYFAGWSGLIVTNNFGIGIMLAVFCVCFLGYSVVYAALLSAMLGIKHAVGKRENGERNTYE
ncbi:MAG: hypothetical protein K2J80_08535 [Oscillospiraceae bacterium]|nr:hypothetical protein [Oscillospiraceae bacterium]